MNDVESLLQKVWLSHRHSVLADLTRLSESIDEWNAGRNSHRLALTIEELAHRICGSLTIVGRRDGLQELRHLEDQATTHHGPYAKEVVDRVHDLLARLRDD